MPPIQESCEFYPLDAAVNAKTQEKPIEVGFHRAASHLELSCDLVVVTALQQQLSDLLLARTQRNRILLHANSPLSKDDPRPGRFWLHLRLPRIHVSRKGLQNLYRVYQLS